MKLIVLFTLAFSLFCTTINAQSKEKSIRDSVLNMQILKETEAVKIKWKVIDKCSIVIINNDIPYYIECDPLITYEYVNPYINEGNNIYTIMFAYKKLQHVQKYIVKYDNLSISKIKEFAQVKELLNR